MVQWFHLYEMSDDSFKLILRTFASVFNDVTIWDVQEDVLLVGSNASHRIDFKQMERAFDRKEVQSDLERIGIGTLPTLLSLHMASDPIIRQMGGKGPLNSDLYPILEYEAPKAFYLGVSSELAREYDERWFPKKEGDILLLNYLKSSNRSLSRSELKDMVRYHKKNDSVGAKGLVVEWARRFPRDPDALWALASVQKDQDNLESASLTLSRLLEVEPRHPEYIEAAADIEYQIYWENQTYLTSARPKLAFTYYKRLLELQTNHRARIQFKLAKVYEVVHEYQEAIDSLDSAANNAVKEGEKSEKLDTIWLAAAKIARKMKNSRLALRYARKAFNHNRENSEAEEMVRELSFAAPELH